MENYRPEIILKKRCSCYRAANAHKTLLRRSINRSDRSPTSAHTCLYIRLPVCGMRTHIWETSEKDEIEEHLSASTVKSSLSISVNGGGWRRRAL